MALNNKPNDLKRNDNWRTDGLDKNVIQTVTTSQLYQDAYKKETHGKGASTPKEYLARGHLTPNADFATQDKRDATFFFINAAPQWQYFNGGSGNWARLEKAIREYAQEGQGQTLHVITGTYGISNDGSMDWYLDWQSKGGSNKKIPVPKFFWKIVYDGNRGAAFVGSNEDTRNTPQIQQGNNNNKMAHPDADAVNQKYPTDRCDEKYGEEKKGIIWCYTIEEIFKVLPNLNGFAVPLLQQDATIKKNVQYLDLWN